LVTNRTSTYGVLSAMRTPNSDQPPDSHANDAGDKYDEYHDSARTEV
jgi:hypothetical protein